MVTSTDKAMVVGKRDSKTSQSMPAKTGLSSEHFRKFLWGHPGEMGCRQKEEWRAQGMGSLTPPPHPQLTSEDSTARAAVEREGCSPREGCSLTQDGTEGLHCASG